MSSTSGTTPIYLTSSEAAELLRIAPATLERMRINGLGPRFAKVGPGKRAKVVYKRVELLAWLEGNTFASTSQYKQSGS